MGIPRVFNKKTKKWEAAVSSANIPIVDMSNSYTGSDVESAFQEVAAWNTKNSTSIDRMEKTLETHEEKIEYLVINGGGSGGSGGAVVPTITSTIEADTIELESGQSLRIPIFFSSANLGEGLAFVSFDDIQYDTYTVKQGNNTLDIGPMKKLQTKVSVYVKDRAGLLSNIITWKVINGGIELTLDFDYTVDFVFGRDIVMPYNINTPYNNPVILNITIDFETISVACENGYNDYTFSNLGVGIHKIELQATDQKYFSKKYEFSLVVIDSDSLYLTTTFDNGEYLYGVPISINYRISNGDDSKFNLNLYLDGVLAKTQNISRGSYYWIINDRLDLGDHTYKIELLNGDDTRTIEGAFKVIQGSYTPLSINDKGLIYRLDPSTRTNDDSDKETPMYNGIKAKLHNFNYSSNGWIDGELICSGGAYVDIDFYPWLSNEDTANGSTIEIYYKAFDIGRDALVFDYSDSETPKGAKIGLNQCKLSSMDHKDNTSFVTTDKYIKVSFVIDRKQKFGKIFIDGICSRAFTLSDSGSGVNTVYEDFAHGSKIYLNYNKETDITGYCNIADVLVYRRALTDDEIIKNGLSYQTNLIEQQTKYEFEFNNTSLPQIRMYGDTTAMTLENAVQMRIKYTSTNSEKYGQSFDLPYCLVNWQGTSSIGYVLKNFQVRLLDQNMQPYYYSPYPNGIPEYIFTFKADYMESSHGRNVGTARLCNDCVFTTKNPAQLQNSKVRNSIDGFSCVLYINDELQGIYNFNADRYSNNVFGYTDPDKTLVYEVSANTDSTAGAFYAYNKDVIKDKSELEYYKSDFMCIYPPTRAAGNDNYTEIKRLVEWVDGASDEDFRDNLEQYFNKEYLLRYFIVVQLFGLVDSLGKNMKLATWDGNIWYPQVYDMDTSCGLDNSGFLKFNSDIEIGDVDVFNTTGSKLWQKVMLLLMDDIKSEYAKLRNTTLTLDNILKYIIEDQIEKIPSTFYNHDMQTKYLNFGSTYLYALHGNSKNQLIKFISDRLIYIDTLYDYTVTTTDFVTIRSSKQGIIYLDIETFVPMYLRIKWRNEADGAATQKLRVGVGQTVRFSFNETSEGDQEVLIYGGKYLKSIGDISNLEPTTINIGNAPRLTKLICHSENLINTDLGKCENLTYVDLSGCINLGTGVGSNTTLDISKCMNLQYIDIRNTTLASVLLDPRGSNIEEIWYPNTVESIVIQNCPNLRIIGLDRGHNCKQLNLINCPNVEAFGDREWSNSYNRYIYSNGWFLSGVQSISLDNSYINTNVLDIQYPVGLKNVVLKNMPNLVSIKLGVNSPTDGSYSVKNNVHLSYDYIGIIPTLDTLTISSVNTPKLKDFYITGFGKKSFEGFDISNIGKHAFACYVYYANQNNYSYSEDLVLINQASNFRKNILDLSNTTIENLYFYATTQLNGLKIPLSTKKLYINKFYDLKENAKGTNFDYYNTIYDDSPGGAMSNAIVVGSNQTQPEKWYEGLFAPTFIANIWTNNNSEYTPLITDPIWNFDGIEDIEIYNNCMHLSTSNNQFYSTSSTLNNNIKDYTLKNAKIKSKDFTMSMYKFTKFENVILDLSEFIGKSFRSGLANTTTEVSIQYNDWSTVFKNVTYVKEAILNANNQNVEWKIIEQIYPKLTKGEDMISDFQNTVLKEQSDYETDGVYLINSKIDNIQSNSTYKANVNWFGGTNLKYVKGVTVKTSCIARMFANSNLVKIGDIDFGVNGTGMYYFGAFGLFNSATKLTDIGNITFHQNGLTNDTKSGFNNFLYTRGTINSLGKISVIDPNGGLGSFGDAFRRTTFNCDIDLSEFGTINSLIQAFLDSTVNGTIYFPAISGSLNYCFNNAIIDTINFTGSVNNGGWDSAFFKSTIQNIIGLTYIPNNISTLNQCFREASIGNGMPLLSNSSLTEIFDQMFYNYKGNIPFDSIKLPSCAKQIENMFRGAKLPQNFTLDLSSVEYLLAGRYIFDYAKAYNSFSNITIKLPKYVYKTSLGTEATDGFRNTFTAFNTLRKITFDYTNYSGNLMGLYKSFDYMTNSDLTINGIDTDTMFGGTTPVTNANSKIYLSNFTVRKPASKYDIDFRYFRMSKDNISKFISEGLDVLDCNNILQGYTFSSRSVMIEHIWDKSQSLVFSVSQDVIDYFTANKNNSSSYGFALHRYNSDDTFNSGLYLNMPKSSITIGIFKNSSKYLIKPNNVRNITDDILNNWVKTDDISLRLVNSTDSPHTLTLSKYTNYDGTTSLSADDVSELSLQAIRKGWNLAFV